MHRKYIALIADAYPPMRSSAAIQLKDLSIEFAKQGYRLTMILPDSEIKNAFEIADVDGIQVCRLKTLRMKEISLFFRATNEALSPLLMILRFRKSPLAKQKWDGIIWYSPSIFFGVFVSYLKKRSTCKAYLILRDIFPKWALDLGLMKKEIPYYFFKSIENYQYRVADSIGVQSSSNLKYFESDSRENLPKVEVLQNWLSESEVLNCSVNLAATILANRIIFVYAGNVGAAQGVDIFLNLAQLLDAHKEVGILLIGRGSELNRLRDEVVRRDLNNILIMDEIDSSEMPGLYKQCPVGLVALDSRHQTHNVPGKFLSYMQAGLPVLAKVNLGNDLMDLINNHQVGYAFHDKVDDNMKFFAEKLLEDLSNGNAKKMRLRATELSKNIFSTKIAVKQISSALDLSLVT
jgi:glycosyltransferase involved in cell wall biosynthesis